MAPTSALPDICREEHPGGDTNKLNLQLGICILKLIMTLFRKTSQGFTSFCSDSSIRQLLRVYLDDSLQLIINISNYSANGVNDKAKSRTILQSHSGIRIKVLGNS